MADTHRSQIQELAPPQAVQLALFLCQKPFAEGGDALLELDQRFFCSQAPASASQKIEAVLALLRLFVSEDDAVSMERAHEREDTTQGASLFEKARARSEKLTERMVAGVVLLDICGYSWDAHKFEAEQSQLLPQIVEMLMKPYFENYSLRNIQARLIALLLDKQIFQHQVESEEFENEVKSCLEPVAEKIQEDDFVEADLGMRIVRYLIEKVDEREAGQLSRNLHPMVPIVLPALFAAFTNEATEGTGRVLILHLFYTLIRLVAWADGIDNELVQGSLDETFQSWMALFLQLIQSNPRQHFNLKRNALKCLVVIFRDLINYSKNSINLILKPAWKLLIAHLPIFQEVVAFGQPLASLGTGADDAAEDEDEDEDEQNQLGEGEAGNESFDVDEIYGVEGMTFHLLELLCSLVQRPNVQSLVLQGLLPLATTVTGYLLVQGDHERAYQGDATFFIIEKGQEMLRVQSVRNQCLTLISSLIEVFGDDAVRAVLLIAQSILTQKQLELPAVEESGQPAKEESKSEGGDEADEEAAEQRRNEQEFRAMLAELVYVSKHKKNPIKQREVAILLIGTFVEDVSMFLIRNPVYDMLQTLFDELLKTDFDAMGRNMRSLLVGQTLWCATAICDLVPKFSPNQENAVAEKFRMAIMESAFVHLKEAAHTSVKLAAIRTLIRYSRKFTDEQLGQFESQFTSVMEALLELLDTAPLECLFLPIEAISTFSKLNEQLVAEMSPRVTPKLLKLFRDYHSEGALGAELTNLFKKWCNFSECREIFVETFIPFIMEIVGLYFQSTANMDNSGLSFKDKLALLASEETKGASAVDEKEDQKVVDASILSHVLDLLCALLKNSKTEEDKAKVIQVFPQLLSYVERSEDMFLLLNGTQTLKTFIHLGHQHVLKHSTAEQIVSVCKKLLSPQANEQSALYLGNLVIQVIHKIQPRIDTSLLMCVVQKIYKSRMPSIVQSLVLIFARLIQTNPTEIVQFLVQTSIEFRICLKIVLDKWFLQQALFRGAYTRTVTLSAVCKMFLLRDENIEKLMVITYNPSHANINSEVNAPFKMLSLLLRFLDVETKPTNKRPIRQPIEDYDEDEEGGRGPPGGSAFGQFAMPRAEDLQVDSGARMDTYNDDELSDYGDSDGAGRRGFGNLDEDDKLDVDFDDLPNEDDDDGQAINLDKPTSVQAAGKAKEESKEGAGNTSGSSDGEQAQTSNQSTGGSSGEASTGNLFAVGESNDKGLADMETGSEVYMSELLAGFDMEDFDDAEEMNEEDLISLGDEFAKIDLVNHVRNAINTFILNADQGAAYVHYCAQQLPKEDQLLAMKFLTFPKNLPPLAAE